MNPEIKQQWVDALRSGEYPQSTNYLRDKTGWCCLGVLTDLFIKATGAKSMAWVLPDDNWHKESCYLWDPESDAHDTDEMTCQCRDHYLIHDPLGELDTDSILPAEVVRWAGLEDYNPAVRIPCDHTEGKSGSGKCLACEDSETRKVRLSELNDDPYLCWNFTRIAAVVDEQL